MNLTILSERPLLYTCHVKKFAAAFFIFAFCIAAADFWQAKPYTEWTDKDLQKMITNSPWAKSFSPPAPAGGPGDSGASTPLSEGGGRGRGGGVPFGGPAAADSSTAPTIYARWQSALPVKQAFVRLKYGAEAATSPDAKQLLDRPETNYEIVVSGPLKSMLRGDTDTLKLSLMESSSLTSKGKGPVKPSDVQIALSRDSNDMVLHFPRTTPFTADDKEVEFETKFGDLVLRYKFKVKDMVFNGKLEM
jgi:hypothetical protein